MGPTASGKSALALALARALRRRDRQRRFGAGLSRHGHRHGEADAATRARVPHHLIDIVDPTEAYSAARFRADAIAAIAGDPRARRACRSLVGGTMLYFKALTRRLRRCRAPIPRVRARLDARAAREGWPALHAELARVDPATAARLDAHRRAAHPARARSARARPAGRCRSCRARAKRGGALGPDDRRRARARRIARVCTRRSRERFDAMLDAGLVDELAALARALSRSTPEHAVDALRRLPPGVGSSSTARSTRATLRARGIAATRQLAKRQFTWLRATPADGVRSGGAATSPTRRRRSLRARRRVPPRLTADCCCAIIASFDCRAGHAGAAMTMHARTLYDKLWDSHVVRAGSRRHGAALHRPPPRARGDEPAGVTRACKLAGRKPWRVGSIVATADHNTPTQATGTRASRDPDLAHAGRDARRQHRASTAPRRTSRSSTGARASST